MPRSTNTRKCCLSVLRLAAESLITSPIVMRPCSRGRLTPDLLVEGAQEERNPWLPVRHLGANCCLRLAKRQVTPSASKDVTTVNSILGGLKDFNPIPASSPVHVQHSAGCSGCAAQPPNAKRQLPFSGDDEGPRSFASLRWGSAIEMRTLEIFHRVFLPCKPG